MTCPFLTPYIRLFELGRGCLSGELAILLFSRGRRDWTFDIRMVSFFLFVSDEYSLVQMDDDVW